MMCCYSLEGGKVSPDHIVSVNNMVKVLYGGKCTSDRLIADESRMIADESR
ncbi:hypothetical protein J9253_00490 [Thiothrix litoralis]|jgi:hypothetical protein|uniref:Uncharacterized protein n=1 Tax=Thiothrix litoralis TaxID=2891210 RepID=A0ABX7WW26_9GAMM|nr:hypothetical protein [Thiothrix litoralis]QTR46478.1 hypothetical protein J9253_00490 [Thiothrix litoralis]